MVQLHEAIVKSISRAMKKGEPIPVIVLPDYSGPLDVKREIIGDVARRALSGEPQSFSGMSYDAPEE